MLVLPLNILDHRVLCDSLINLSACRLALVRSGWDTERAQLVRAADAAAERIAALEAAAAAAAGTAAAAAASSAARLRELEERLAAAEARNWSASGADGTGGMLSTTARIRQQQQQRLNASLAASEGSMRCHRLSCRNCHLLVCCRCSRRWRGAREFWWCDCACNDDYRCV